MNKKYLKAAAALALVFTLGACSSDSNPDNGTNTDGDTTQTQGERKVLNLVETSDLPTLVSWKATDAVSFLALGNVTEGLVSLGENATIHPGVAESWSASEDGLTYTFNLRQDSNWITSEGDVYANVTANDFVYAWKQLINPDSGAQYSFMIKTAGIKGGAEALALSENLVTYDATVVSLDTLDVADFEDGETTAQEQFDAEKASLETTLSELESTIVAEGFSTIEEAREGMTTLIDALGVKAVDDYTLEVTLEVATPYFLSLMAFPSFYPASEAFVNEVTMDAYGTSVDTFLYNGPFTFEEWIISSRHYWEKNEQYWDAANVALDAIDFRVVVGIENSTQIGMYKDGEIALTPLSGENVAVEGSRPDAVVEADTAMWYIDLNQGSGEPTIAKQVFSNVKARQAINMIIDKAFITDEILANGSQVANFFVPNTFAFGPEGSSYAGVDFRETNGDLGAFGTIEEAQALWNEALAEEGITEDFEINFLIMDTASMAKMAPAVKNDMEAALDGITEVVIETVPFANQLERKRTGDFDMTIAGWGPDYQDPMTFLDMYVTGGSYNSAGYANPEYDAMIEEAKTGEVTANPEARWELLLEAEQLLIDQEQVIIPLFQVGAVRLIDQNVSGLYYQKIGPDYFYKWTDINSAE